MDYVDDEDLRVTETHVTVELYRPLNLVNNERLWNRNKNYKTSEIHVWMCIILRASLFPPLRRRPIFLQTIQSLYLQRHSRLLAMVIVNRKGPKLGTLGNISRIMQERTLTTETT